MSKRISVEICHIYVNETFSHEHENSIKNFINLKDKLYGDQSDVDLSTVVMIDDYNPTFDVLNREDLFSTINQNGVTLDFFVYESNLLIFVERLLSDISEDIRAEYTRYINKKGKVPCSFLIAVFYLLRLDYFPLSESMQIINCVANKNKNAFFADRIYNVLDSKYTAVEAKAMRILDSLVDSKGVKITNRINGVFY